MLYRFAGDHASPVIAATVVEVGDSLVDLTIDLDGTTISVFGVARDPEVPHPATGHLIHQPGTWRPSEN